MNSSRIGAVFGGWPRRLVALTCLLLAVVSALHSRSSAAKASAPTVGVLVAARSLAVGTMLVAADVRVSSWPPGLVPASGLRAPADAIGHRLAGALAAGEILTSARLVSGDLASGLPRGTVAAPVPLASAAAANLIRAGDYVDLISPPGQDASSAPARVVALDVLVLAVVPASPDSTDAGAQLVVAVDRDAELTLAQAVTTPMLATVDDHP